MYLYNILGPFISIKKALLTTTSKPSFISYSPMIKKSFQVFIQNFQIQISYQPANIQFSVTDCNTNNIVKQALFYDNNLPEQIKSHLLTVYDLYNELQLREQGQIQLQNEYLKFKSSKSDKEWLSCQLNDEVDGQESNMRYKLIQYEQEMKELCLMKDQVEQQNQQLRKQIEIMKRINNFLQKEYKMMKWRLLNMGNSIRTPLEDNHNQQMTMIEECNQNKPLNKDNGLQAYISGLHEPTSNLPKINYIHLTPSLYPNTLEKFHINSNIITKTNEGPEILIFNEVVNGNKQGINSFNVSVSSQMQGHFFVLGVITSEHFDKPFCYFFKNCIALSASLGLLMIELQLVELGFALKKGDHIQVLINTRSHCIEWILNRELLCLHKIPASMMQSDLFAFIILANSDDCVQINPLKYA